MEENKAFPFQLLSRLEILFILFSAPCEPIASYQSFLMFRFASQVHQ